MKLIIFDKENKKIVFEEECIHNDIDFGDLRFTTFGYYFVQTSPTFDFIATNIEGERGNVGIGYNINSNKIKKIKITVELLE